MAINIDPAVLTAVQAQAAAEREVTAYVDAVFHDQHGDSTRWTEFEWDSYYRTINRALDRYRSDNRRA